MFFDVFFRIIVVYLLYIYNVLVWDFLYKMFFVYCNLLLLFDLVMCIIMRIVICDNIFSLVDLKV